MAPRGTDADRTAEARGALRILCCLFGFALLFRLAFDQPIYALWGALTGAVLVVLIAPVWILIAIRRSPVDSLTALAGTLLFLAAISTTESMPDRSRFGTTSHVASLLLALLAISWIGSPHSEKFGTQLSLSTPRVRRALVWVVALHVAFFATVTALVYARVLPSSMMGAARTSFRETAIFQFVLVAMAEEIAYRGFLQSWLDRLFPERRHFLGCAWGWGALVSGLTFGLLHAVHVSMQPFDMSMSFHPVLVQAFLFVYLRTYSGSVWPAVVAHGLWNGLNNTLPFIGPHG